MLPSVGTWLQYSECSLTKLTGAGHATGPVESDDATLMAPEAEFAKPLPETCVVTDEEAVSNKELAVDAPLAASERFQVSDERLEIEVTLSETSSLSWETRLSWKILSEGTLADFEVVSVEECEEEDEEKDAVSERLEEPEVEQPQVGTPPVDDPPALAPDTQLMEEWPPAVADCSQLGVDEGYWRDVAGHRPELRATPEVAGAEALTWAIEGGAHDNTKVGAAAAVNVEAAEAVADIQSVPGTLGSPRQPQTQIAIDDATAKAERQEGESPMDGGAWNAVSFKELGVRSFVRGEWHDIGSPNSSRSLPERSRSIEDIYDSEWLSATEKSVHTS